MTDHTAIIERAVTAYVSTLNSQPEDERNALVAMEAALAASGLLEVPERAEAKLNAYLGILEDARQGYHNNELWSEYGPDAIGPTYDRLLNKAELELRNAIKGVRDE